MYGSRSSLNVLSNNVLEIKELEKNESWSLTYDEINTCISKLVWIILHCIKVCALFKLTLRYTLYVIGYTF